MGQRIVQPEALPRGVRQTYCYAVSWAGRPGTGKAAWLRDGHERHAKGIRFSSSGQNSMRFHYDADEAPKTQVDASAMPAESPSRGNKSPAVRTSELLALCYDPRENRSNDYGPLAMTTPLSYNRDFALNAICPYFTMFPLEFPLRIVRKHRRDSPLVIDPFCGRGTTIYAARKAGLPSVGFDVSPIAVAIARAKLASAPAEAILELAESLLATEPSQVPDSSFFHKAYAKGTLRELCSLREGLLEIGRETDESVLLRAAVLGCLHGPRSKYVSNAGYFSNQMPRTFASKPAYSVRFWNKRGLCPPNVRVLDVLRRKLERIADLDKPHVGSFVRVRCADARYARPYRSLKGRLLVVTSPPYYGMRTYVQDQWLRNWFLGGPEEVDYGAGTHLRHSSHADFSEDLARVWSHLKKRSDEIELYVRFGTIHSAKSDARKLFKASLEESGGWKLISTRRARTASSGRRQAAQMQAESEPPDEFDFHARAA